MTTFALFQARRSDDPMAVHEQDCVRKGLGLSPDEFAVWNLVDSPPPQEFLDGADAYLIGGSGAFHVFDDHPWLTKAFHLCRDHFIAGQKPFLGLCFGHQLLAAAAGAEVINDPEREEVGTFEVELTTSSNRRPFCRYARALPCSVRSLGSSLCPTTALGPSRL